MSGVPSATEIYKEFTVTEKALTVTTLVPGEPPSWQERKHKGENLLRSNLREPGQLSWQPEFFPLTVPKPSRECVQGRDKRPCAGELSSYNLHLTETLLHWSLPHSCQQKEHQLILGVKEFRRVLSPRCQNSCVDSSSEGSTRPSAVLVRFPKQRLQY